MEEEKLKKIFFQTDKDCSRYSEFFKQFFKQEYISNKNLLIFSISLSSLFTYNYLNKKIIYRENNGHFNSPQTLLNKKLTKNYLFEGGFRFLLGSTSIFAILNLFKIYYLKIEEPLFDYNSYENKKEKYKKDIEDIILIKKEIGFEGQNFEEKDKNLIVKIGRDDISEDEENQSFANKIFSIDKSVTFRNNINKYFEQYKNK